MWRCNMQSDNETLGLAWGGAASRAGGKHCDTGTCLEPGCPVQSLGSLKANRKKRYMGWW